MTVPEPNLAALAAAGFGIETFTPEQRAVLAGLCPTELALLLDLKARFDEVEPEVQAHASVAGAALF